MLIDSTIGSVCAPLTVLKMEATNLHKYAETYVCMYRFMYIFLYHTLTMSGEQQDNCTQRKLPTITVHFMEIFGCVASNDFQKFIHTYICVHVRVLQRQLTPNAATMQCKAIKFTYVCVPTGTAT